MNGRMYDSELCSFISPDPQMQVPDYWLNHNRYVYCLNNPLKYTDPDGQFWQIVIGATIGGVVNLAINWDNCDYWWEYVATFSAGAVAGAAVAVTGNAGFFATVAVGAGCGSTVSATNSVVYQYRPDNESVDWSIVGHQASNGAIFGGTCSAIGYAVQPYFSSLSNNGSCVSTIASCVAEGVICGAGAGLAVGLANGIVYDDWNVEECVANGIIYGAASGVIKGVSQCVIQYQGNKLGAGNLSSENGRNTNLVNQYTESKISADYGFVENGVYCEIDVVYKNGVTTTEIRYYESCPFRFDVPNIRYDKGYPYGNNFK